MNRDTVIGIDPSMCSTGIVVLDSGGVLQFTTTLSSKPLGHGVAARMERIEGVARQVMQIVKAFRPKVVCIEGYSFGSISSNVSQIAEFGGLIRYVLFRECRVIEVAPSCLKKWATGKGAFKGGGKTPMIVEMTTKYGVEFMSDDQYDAYALARMAMQIAGFENPHNATQRNAIDVSVNGKPKKVRKPKVTG